MKHKMDMRAASSRGVTVVSFWKQYYFFSGDLSAVMLPWLLCYTHLISFYAADLSQETTYDTCVIYRHAGALKVVYTSTGEPIFSLFGD